MRRSNLKVIISTTIIVLFLMTGISSSQTLTGTKLSLNESITDDTNEKQIYSILYPTTTSSSTSYHVGAENFIRPIINTGVTQSGYEMGFYLQLFRNTNGSNADDNGTLSSLIGQRIQYGHYNTNTSADPQTTNAYGLTITPYYKTGDITNLYDIYISPGSDGGVVTNRYGIYQASTLAKNYFGGNVGIGTTSPSALLHINSGASNTNAIFESEDSIVLLSMKDNSTTGKGYAISRTGDNIKFYTSDSSRMMIDSSGNVGIGTTSPNYKLDVLGTIRAQEVKVATGWSDFVFDEGYNLPSLSQVESYIEENKHLPDIPSAQDIQENGLSMAEMMAKQMQKIEELTLYLIEQNKRLDQIVIENQELRKQIVELKNMK